MIAGIFTVVPAFCRPERGIISAVEMSVDNETVLLAYSIMSIDGAIVLCPPVITTRRSAEENCYRNRA